MVASRHRNTVRVIVRTPENRFLMFFSRFEPEVDLPPQWIFPGGGIEPGESILEAAVRELLEETGLQVTSEALEGPWAQLEFEFDSKLNFDTGTAWFFTLDIDSEFSPSNLMWTEDEHRDTIEHRWLTLEEIQAENLWIGPRGAIDVLRERIG